MIIGQTYTALMSRHPPIRRLLKLNHLSRKVWHMQIQSEMPIVRVELTDSHFGMRGQCNKDTAHLGGKT